jgi:hypothetical protein
MTTLCSEINDLFLTEIDDYRIDIISATSGSTALNTYLEPYLLKSIDDFGICNQPLIYTPTSGSVEGSFSVTLNQENIDVLSQLMQKYWFKKTINNVLQMQNNLQDRDYKSYSQAQNLAAKQSYYNGLKEELSQLLVDYGNKHNAWSDWNNQIFS